MLKDLGQIFGPFCVCMWDVIPLIKDFADSDQDFHLEIHTAF